MKRLLLVGQFTAYYQLLKDQLASKLEVTACANKDTIVNQMIKIKRPDAILVVIEELNADDRSVLSELNDHFTNIPAFCYNRSLRADSNETPISEKRFISIPSTFQPDEVLLRICTEIDDTSELDIHSLLGSDEEEVKEQPEIKQPSKTILIVDDSGIYLRMIKRLLEAENYHVIATSSGTHALTLIKDHRPDLILLDYEMPLFNGKQTMQKIRESEEYKNIPIVFVTAVNDTAHIKEVLVLKPAGYILKPIDKIKLLTTIRNILG